MEITRRKFILGTACALGTAGLFHKVLSVSSMTPARAQSDGHYRGTVAVLQGFTNANSTQLTIMYDKNSPISYRILNEINTQVNYEITKREAKIYSLYAIDKISVGNLLLGTTYRLQVLDEKTGKVIDERNFAALDLGKSDTRFVIATCMKDNMPTQREVMWDRVAETKPDFILLPGDTSYADQSNDGTEAGYWKRYAETRFKLSHFRQKDLVPTLAVWDDHDMGKNNCDGDFKSKTMVREIFQIFWDSEERQGLVRGPGQSFVFSGFGQRFFMMDGRYFKAKAKTGGKLWGTEQEQFLFDQLAKNNSPAWLINGTLFFGGYLQCESFEKDHSENFKQVLKQLSTVEAPVNFISGDIHFSEIMKIEPEILGYETVEYVSSSIHSSYFPNMHLRGKNPRRVKAVTAHNFMVFESSYRQTSGEWNIQMDCLNSEMGKLMTHQKTIRRS
jgi:alkaline phosphatase D